jgi:hypothetical protein
MNPSDIGSYGSLCLMKRLTQDVVTVYPIDDDEVTFGCDPGCNVRLYYDEIDALHCKIIFRERKVSSAETISIEYALLIMSA